MARVDIDSFDTSHNACADSSTSTVETVRPNVQTQQSGNCNGYTEIYDILVTVSITSPKVRDASHTCQSL